MTQERAESSEVDRYERITTLLRAASAARNASEFASFALAQATAAVGAPAGLVVSVRGDLAHVVASQGMSSRLLARFPARVGANLPVTEAIARNLPMWIEDRARVATRESDLRQVVDVPGRGARPAARRRAPRVSSDHQHPRAPRRPNLPVHRRTVERRDESLDVGMERLAESAAALRDVDVQDAVERLGAQVTAQFDDLAILCAEIENAAATR